MCCPKCQSENIKRFGKDRYNVQRHRCRDCGKVFTDDQPKIGRMQLTRTQVAQCLSLMLDGMSIRAVERFMGVNRSTLCDLVVRIGEKCRDFLTRTMKNLTVNDVQVDEVFSFVGCKEKTRINNKYGLWCGDCYAYVAIERDTKLIISYQMGRRDHESTRDFIRQLSETTNSQCFQISTDGWPAYQTTIPLYFRKHYPNYGVIVKTYGSVPVEGARRYSPPAIVSVKRAPIVGSPREDRICTSHIERSNLTLRMTLRRWTRLTNAHSKSWRHHGAAFALYLCFYNFIRVHATLKTTPAVKHGLADRPWKMEELLTAIAA